MDLKRYLGLSISGLFLLQTLPCHATALLEGASEHSTVASYNVELIEGDHRTNTPPIPQLEAEGVLLSSIEMGHSDIPWMITHYNKHLSPQQVHEINSSIHTLSQNYNLDPRLLASVVAVESSFRPRAISRTGAIGLGQLKPATAKWLGVQNPFDPGENLSGVAKYLRYLLNRYNGSVHHALAAYFQGQGTIDRRGIDQHAQTYVEKISRVFNQTFNTRSKP